MIAEREMSDPRRFFIALAFVLSAAFLLVTSADAASDSIPSPKEFGVYAKTDKETKRILPNIVSDDQGVYYLEPNKPQTFTLGTIEYFIIFGNFQMQYLTLNP